MSRFALSALCLVVVLLSGTARASAPPAEDLDPNSVAFVEVAVGRTPVFEQEPIVVVLRVGIDRAFFEESAVPLFQQAMDLPIQVDVPWWSGRETMPARQEEPSIEGSAIGGVDVAEALAGLGSPRETDSSAARLRFVLGDDVVTALSHTEVRDSRDWTVLTLRRAFVPVTPGTWTLDGATLHFAYASEFDVNFFGDRVPRDRVDAHLQSEPLVLEVRELPPPFQPTHEIPAVGRFHVHAEAATQEVRPGQSLRVTLSITGFGNFEFFDPPTSGLAGFHLLGLREDRSGQRRTATYELTVVDSSVTAIPPIALDSFDPWLETRATVETEPIAVTVVGGGNRGDSESDSAGTESATADGGADDLRGPRPLDEYEQPTEHRAPRAVWIAGVLLAPWILARWESGSRAESSVGGWIRTRVGARAAFAGFRAELARSDVDPARALVRYLAARLQCAEAAVIGPRVRDRLRRARVSEEEARALEVFLEQALSAEFGGPGPPIRPVRRAHSPSRWKRNSVATRKK